MANITTTCRFDLTMCESGHSAMEHRDHFSENCVKKYQSFYEEKQASLLMILKFNNK